VKIFYFIFPLLFWKKRRGGEKKSIISSFPISPASLIKEKGESK
jgi:hypothetical protein